MEIKPLAKNAFVLTTREGTRVLYSYGVPVAAHKLYQGYVRSDWFVSRTTSAHVALFCTRGTGARAVPHDEILKIAKEA